MSEHKQSFPMRDFLLTFGILVAAFLLCLLLRQFSSTGTYAHAVFILAIFLIARFTTRFYWGIIVSPVTVLLANYTFTYPYGEFNFTITGYPITILCMLSVSLVTSAMTTQIKQQEHLRAEADKEKTRSNLLRAISHDLRTPLTSILGASTAMLENDARIPTADRKKLLGEIAEDAQWLIHMVENLLSVTRIDGDRSAKVTKKPEAAEEVIASAVAKFRKQFPDAKLRVSVPDVLLIVPMDAFLIEQVLFNLLENAAIHAKDATQCLLAVSSSGNTAVFRISDNGCGIAAHRLPHLFSGSYQDACNQTGDAKKNMGIGLSVCSAIIHAHNGTMQAENQKGGGACFTFTLPLEEEDTLA